MKISTACLQCRTGKRKCSSTRAGDPCSPCQRRRLSCSNQASTSHRQFTDHSLSHVSSEIVQPPYSEEIIYLVDLYFDYIHDKPHTLFHKPTLKASVLDGTISRTVLLSMIGISSRFAETPELQARGPMYAKAAKDTFKADLEHVCIENIQACCIIANICLADSDSKAESLYYALAIRMALILNLASKNAAEDGITQEITRRVWWTCFLVDIWSSGGSSISRQISSTSPRPRLPVEELMFINLRPKDEDITDLNWRHGIWSHMVAMVEVFREIQDLIRYLVVITEWDEDFIETTVDDLAIRLLAFEERFEPELQFSTENVAFHAARGTGRLYVGFHLGYQYYFMLLFYQYLDKNRPPTANGQAYADRCKLHARKFCDVLRISRENKQAEALHYIIGHVTVVSSSVLLHTYIFGDASELLDTISRLESNMEALMQLRTYWPGVEQVIDRLVVFLKNCVKSTTSNNTHRFDKWMVKFLQEYAMTLDEKDDCEDSTSLFSDVGNSGLGQRSRVIRDVMSAYRNGGSGSGLGLGGVKD